MKRFFVYRYDPSVTIYSLIYIYKYIIIYQTIKNAEDQPKYMSYYVDLKKIPPMYLDALLYIKDNYDSTLSLRR